jgi:hypothetical protein
MASNPFTDLEPASGAQQPTADPFADLTPKAAAPKPRGFPYDEPGQYYPKVLPLRPNPQTGKTELVAPEIIRSPARGMVEINRRLTEPYQPRDLTANPDITGLVSLLGGTRVSPGLARLAPGASSSIARVAHDAGYVLPPIEAVEQPGVASKVLSGISGKIKTQQLASEKNQDVTNGLAAEDLGLPRGTKLTEQVFSDLRKGAGQAWDALVKAVPNIQSNLAFRRAASLIGQASTRAGQYFPSTMKNPGVDALRDELTGLTTAPTRAVLDAVQELRSQAVSHLNTPNDPIARALGLAQRKAADLLDALIEHNAARAGKPGLVDVIRKARTLIAKSYDVEGATNKSTGDVSAVALSRLAAHGRPLSGNLDTIARVGGAFPKNVQDPARFGGAEPYSALDFFAALGSAAVGRPEGVVAALSRAPVRHTILSKPYQRGMMDQPAWLPGPAARRVESLPYNLRAIFNPGLSPFPNATQQDLPPQPIQ